MIYLGIFVFSFTFAAIAVPFWTPNDPPTQGYYQQASQGDQPQYFWPNNMWRFIAFVLAAFALAIVLIEETFEPATSSFLRWLEKPAVSATWLGFLAGALVARYREPIKARASEFYSALLGGGEKSAWALQTGTALLILVAIVAAINPALFDRLTSIKAGEVEAHFSEVSATIQTAKISISNTYHENTISRYVNFEEVFFPEVGPQGGPREYGIKHLDDIPDDLKKARAGMRKIIFENYISPFARATECLFRFDRNPQVHKDQKIFELALAVRRKLLDIGPSKAAFTQHDWSVIIETLAEKSQEYSKIIDNDNNPRLRADCLTITIPTPEKQQQDARELGQLSSLAANAAREDPSLASFRLLGMEPYLVAAATDLVGLTIDNTERANFLAEVAPRYLMDEDHLHPGVINLHYQLVDAELNSPASWPFNDIVKEIDGLIDASERYIAEGRQNNREDVERVYMQNKLVFTTMMLDAIIRRHNAGDSIEPAVKRRWAKAFVFLQTVFALRGQGASTSLTNDVAPVFSDADARLWSAIPLDTDYLFDADVDMALSSVLLEGSVHASTTACETARYYLDRAEEGAPIKTGTLSVSDKMRTRGYLAQVAATINVACGSAH